MCVFITKYVKFQHIAITCLDMGLNPTPPTLNTYILLTLIHQVHHLLANFFSSIYFSRMHQYEILGQY